MTDADDDVQLTGALVDHLHIDMRMGQGRENSSRSSPGGLHTPAYHSDQGQIRFQLDVVRMYGLVDPCNDLLLLFLKDIFMDKDGHGINPGRHMLDRNLVFFKHLQHLATESYLGIHHGLFNGNGNKAVCPRNSRDGVPGLPAGALHDQSSLVLGLVRVADVDRNARLSHRENGILMKHACPHIGQLPQLLVGDGLNGLGILDNPGIRNQKAGYIGPVLIQIRLHGQSHQRTGDI